MDYSTTQLANHFGVSRTTIINWTNEFVRYLSENANPPNGMKRKYTEDDIRVFQIVSTMHKTNTYEEIHASLQAGNLDAISLDIVESPADSSIIRNEIALRNRIEKYEILIEELRAERNEYRKKAERFELIKELYDEVRNEASESLKERDREIGELNEKIKMLENKIKLLSNDDEADE